MNPPTIDLTRLKSLIAELAPAFGPSGEEGPIRELIAARVRPLVDEVRTDALGNLIAVKRGGASGARRVMVSAHMDEIGVIVTHIDDDGFLRFAPVGAMRAPVLLGQRVMFDDGTVGTVGSEKLDDPKDLKLDRLFIDIGAASRKEAAERVRIGSMAVYAQDVRAAGRCLTGKALDDRSGCAALIEVMHQLQAEPSPHDVYFVFSVQEEVGLRGARTAAYAIEPDVAFAVDVTATGDIPKGERLAVKVGGGAAIKIKDRSLITHPRLRRLLIDTAEACGIPYQLEVLPYGGTDAGAVHLTRAGVPSGVISIPTRYLHTPGEMLDPHDVAAAAALLAEALRNPLAVGPD
ncbi:MAG: M42 family metallopeptidase [Firmicutes bacterium]|nr:M42 family metallopeptidase [Bacillota bacterium]